MQLKKKTIDYLHTSANKLETLFGQAVEYRAKFDKATSSVAKEMYSKKLKKIVKKMEPYMGLFRDMQKLKQLEDGEVAEVQVTDEATAEE